MLSLLLHLKYRNTTKRNDRKDVASTVWPVALASNGIQYDRGADKLLLHAGTDMTLTRDSAIRQDRSRDKVASIARSGGESVDADTRAILADW